jgi:hypothetical protein
MTETNRRRMKLEDAHTRVDEFEEMLYEAIERYRGVLEELAEL